MAAAGPSPSRSRSRGFVGRARDLDELADVLASAAGGRGGLVLLTGEAGIGKTRLCEELAERARASGFTVAWAGCWESDAVPAFWPWSQLLRQLGQEAALVDGPGAVPERADADLARLQLFDAVAGALHRAAAHRPLLLVIDDLHWADLPSLRLLGFVAPLLAAEPIVLAGTYRDADAGVVDEVVGHGRRLALGGLSPAETAALIEAVTGTAPSSSTATAVHHHTGGNPLFAREVVRLVGADGVNVPGFTGSSGGLPVPATVRGVLSRRLERLSEGCRDVLGAGAVAGDEFTVEGVAEVCGLDRDRLFELLGEAVAARLVRESGLGRYAFAHALVRAAVYDALGVGQRVKLHERTGRALEALRDRGHDVDLAALAHHFGQAAPGGAAGPAARYGTEAARQAMAVLAYEDAARLLERVLAALDLDPGTGDRIEVLLGLGDAEAASGDLPAARRAYLEAARLARAAGRPEALARAALGLGSGGGFEVALFDQTQIDLLAEALAGLEDGPSPLRAWLTARLSVAQSLTASEGERLDRAEVALRLARDSGDEGALAYALAAHCDAIAGPADAERRAEEAGEIIALAGRSGQRRMELLGRRLRLVALLEQGDLVGVDAEIDAFARLAETIRQPLYSWYVPLWRGMRALMRGGVAECDRFRADAEVIGERAGSDNAAILTVTLRFCRLLETGDTAETLALLDPLLDQWGAMGTWVRITMALIQAAGGRLAEAKAGLDAVAPQALPAVPRDSEWLPMLTQVAETVLRIGGHPVAEWAYDAALPYRHRFAVEGIGAACHGSFERPLAVLAASLGRRREAEEHFEAALAANAAAGATLMVARTWRDAGLALGDPERQARAAAAYRDLGLTGPTPVAERPPTPTDDWPEAAAGFRLEGEFWTIAYAGRVVRLRDVKGLQALARLLAQPGRELPALDLLDEAGPGAGLPPGDAGEIIDARARAAYKARLVELEAELEEADAAGDAGRSATTQAEREALLAQLSAAYGLGGRARTAGDPAERARQAATWRVRDGVARVEAVHPELGRHLRRSVKTGAFCVYDPDEPVDWALY